MQITIILSNQIDTSLLMNVDEFKALFFVGIPLKSFENYQLRNSHIEDLIRQNQTYIENLLEIRLSKQILKETRDYEKVATYEWYYIRFFNNINEVISLDAVLNEEIISHVPDKLVNVKKNEIDVFRNVYFISKNFIFWLSYNALMYLYMNKDYIPNFWKCIYITGFDEIPLDLFDYVGKRTLYNIYNIMGNNLLPFGVTSSSKSLDGLSQSTSLSRSATSHLFSGAQKSLMDEFQQTEPMLKTKYRGLTSMRI